MWSFRRLLQERALFGGETFRTGGRDWWGYGQIPENKFVPPRSIAFSKIATHNHFVLDDGRALFSDGTPVIKFGQSAGKDEYFALLALLNSSTACFWMKQVFHNKGIRGQGGGLTVTDWEQFYEFDATKTKLFPVVANSAKAVPYAVKLDTLARTRSARSVRSVLDAEDPSLDHRVDEFVKALRAYARKRIGGLDPREQAVSRDPVLLEDQGHHLMGEHVHRLRSRAHVLDPAGLSEPEERDRLQQRLRREAEERAVRPRSGPSTGAAHPLQKGRHRAWGVDLDDLIEITDVDPKLHRGCADDGGVLASGELLLQGSQVGGHGSTFSAGTTSLSSSSP
jgi:hypothetical protein